METDLQSNIHYSHDPVAKKCEWTIEPPSFEKAKTLIDTEFDVVVDDNNSDIILLRTSKSKFTLLYISFLLFMIVMIYMIYEITPMIGNYRESLILPMVTFSLLIVSIFFIAVFFSWTLIKEITKSFFNPPYINTKEKYIKVGEKILFEDIYAIQIIDGVDKWRFHHSYISIFIVLNNGSRFQIYFGPRPQIYSEKSRYGLNKLIEKAHQISNYIGVDLWTAMRVFKNKPNDQLD